MTGATQTEPVWTLSLTSALRFSTVIHVLLDPPGSVWRVASACKKVDFYQSWLLLYDKWTDIYDTFLNHPVPWELTHIYLKLELFYNSFFNFGHLKTCHLSSSCWLEWVVLLHQWKASSWAIPAGSIYSHTEPPIVHQNTRAILKCKGTVPSDAAVHVFIAGCIEMKRLVALNGLQQVNEQ